MHRLSIQIVILLSAIVASSSYAESKSAKDTTQIYEVNFESLKAEDSKNAFFVIEGDFVGLEIRDAKWFIRDWGDATESKPGNLQFELFSSAGASLVKISMNSTSFLLACGSGKSKRLESEFIPSMKVQIPYHREINFLDITHKSVSIMNGNLRVRTLADHIQYLPDSAFKACSYMMSQSSNCPVFFRAIFLKQITLIKNSLSNPEMTKKMLEMLYSQIELFVVNQNPEKNSIDSNREKVLDVIERYISSLFTT